jgi:hypothetical protein
MPTGKGKVGAGRGRGGGSLGKAPIPKVSSPSAKTTEAARKAALRAKLEQKKGTDTGKSRPAPKPREEQPSVFGGGQYMWYLRGKKGRPAWPPGQ